MLSCVLKILEQLISDHLQTDDPAKVEQRNPTKIHLLKLQSSKQLFSNPGPAHVTAMESLTLF